MSPAAEINPSFYRLCNALSYALHPLLMPTYSMMIIFSIPSYIAYAFQVKYQLMIYSVVLITTFLMPVFSTIILFKRGAVTDMYLENRHERVLPFVLTAIYFFLCFYLFSRLPVPAIMTSAILGCAVAASFALMITLFWKISIHMIGIGGIAGLLFALADLLSADVTWYVFVILCFSGLLGTARLITGQHNAWQIYIGFITGLCIEYVIVKLI